MILKHPKIQRRNLWLSLLTALLVVGWILFFDPAFARTRTGIFMGSAVGYLGFAILDYRNVLHQITRRAHPQQRRISP